MDTVVDKADHKVNLRLDWALNTYKETGICSSATYIINRAAHRRNYEYGTHIDRCSGIDLKMALEK